MVFGVIVHTRHTLLPQRITSCSSCRPPGAVLRDGGEDELRMLQIRTTHLAPNLCLGICKPRFEGGLGDWIGSTAIEDGERYGEGQTLGLYEVLQLKVVRVVVDRSAHAGDSMQAKKFPLLAEVSEWEWGYRIRDLKALAK